MAGPSIGSLIRMTNDEERTFRCHAAIDRFESTPDGYLKLPLCFA